MLYRQKHDTFIRHYDDVGYIVNEGVIADKVVDAVGAVFLDALSREAQSLDDLVARIAPAFRNPPASLRDDVVDFYGMLERDGFVVSGRTPEELDRKDPPFSYARSWSGRPAREKDAAPSLAMAIRDSQTYLSNHFEGHPHLVSLQLEITSRCNERCVHCYIPHAYKTQAMDLELYRSILDQGDQMGLLALTLSGGEPLAHPDFCRMLGMTREHDLSVRILSNLTLLDDKILASIKAARIANIKVSLYSMDPQVHDAITQLPGSHARTVAAIERLRENDVPLMINCPVMRENKDGMDDVLRWGAARDIKTVCDWVMMARYDRSTDNLDHRLTLEEVRPLVQAVINDDAEYRRRVLEADLAAERARDISCDPVCGVCVSSLSVVSDGTVYPCAGWQSRVLGSLREQSLRDIWEKSPEVLYLRRLRMRDFPQCLDCENKPFCAMCMVRNANESPTGNPLDVNPHFCRIAELNREVVEGWLREQGR